MWRVAEFMRDVNDVEGCKILRFVIGGNRGLCVYPSSRFARPAFAGFPVGDPRAPPLALFTTWPISDPEGGPGRGGCEFPGGETDRVYRSPLCGP